MSCEKTPESLKKKRLIALVAVIIAFVILALLNTIDFTGTPSVSTNAPYAPDTLPDIDFYPAPDGDLSMDKNYVKEDRTPSYTSADQTVDDLSESLDSPYSNFFVTYLDALKRGDHTALNALHSEVYFRNHAPYGSFSRQLLYDVEIRYLYKDKITTAESEADRQYVGRYLTYFEVEYKIYHNDGSFRRDIVDDMAIVQIFTLLPDQNGSNLRLNSISYYRPNLPSDADKPSILPLVMPLVFAAMTVISLVVFLIVKKHFAAALTVSSFAAFLVSIKFTLVWQITAFVFVFALAFELLHYLKKKKAPKDTLTE